MYRVHFVTTVSETDFRRDQWSRTVCRLGTKRLLKALNMNVLHVTNSYSPNTGGMATAVHSLVRRLYQLYAAAMRCNHSHGTTPHRHWDSPLAGWVDQALIDGPVPVIQGVRTP